jgi:hypothetical protein
MVNQGFPVSSIVVMTLLGLVGIWTGCRIWVGRMLFPWDRRRIGKVPTWYFVASTGPGVIILLASLAILTSLLDNSSNDALKVVFRILTLILSGASALTFVALVVLIASRKIPRFLIPPRQR